MSFLRMILKKEKSHKRLCRAISETFLEAPPRFELGDQSFPKLCYIRKTLILRGFKKNKFKNHLILGKRKTKK